MITTILLPTDFSENAQHTVNYALDIFNNKDTKFILMNSYEPPRPTGMLINIDDIVKKEAINDLNVEQKKLAANLGERSDQLSIVAQRGDLPEALELVVKQNKGDLIVMGTKGASGLKEILMGSNTANVIKSAVCPVLAVPENTPIAAPKKIVFAADYEHLSDLSSLDPLKEIATLFGSTIMIVNVTSDNDGELSFNPVIEKLTLNDYFKDVNHTYHTVQNDSVIDGINDFIMENEVDMLATIPGRNHFFDKIFHKSVTNKLAMHTSIPLLALRS